VYANRGKWGQNPATEYKCSLKKEPQASTPTRNSLTYSW